MRVSGRIRIAVWFGIVASFAAAILWHVGLRILGNAKKDIIRSFGGSSSPVEVPYGLTFYVSVFLGFLIFAVVITAYARARRLSGTAEPSSCMREGMSLWLSSALYTVPLLVLADLAISVVESFIFGDSLDSSLDHLGPSVLIGYVILGPVVAVVTSWVLAPLFIAATVLLRATIKRYPSFATVEGTDRGPLNVRLIIAVLVLSGVLRLFGVALLDPNSHRADEADIRATFHVPKGARRLSLKNDPHSGSRFGREGLRIIAKFQLSEKDLVDYQRKIQTTEIWSMRVPGDSSELSSQWHSLPLPPELIQNPKFVKLTKAYVGMHQFGENPQIPDFPQPANGMYLCRVVQWIEAEGRNPGTKAQPFRSAHYSRFACSERLDPPVGAMVELAILDVETRQLYLSK